jgi:ribosomal-protein-serine acetyltransferase
LHNESGSKMVTVPERLANNGRFELLPVHAGCVAELFEAVAESKNEISPWMEWCDTDYSIEATKEWVDSRNQAWEQDKEYGFLIVDAQLKQVLGTCGINQVHPTYRFANLGYWIRTSRTREGAATEAIRLLAQFGFSTLQLVRIEIVVAVGNSASQKAAVKAGAMREGLLANRLIHRGENRDAYMFSLVPPVRLPGSIHVR